MAEQLPNLTDEQRQKYLQHRGARCPFCNSENIEGGPVDLDGDAGAQPIECRTCDRTWTDIYTLTDVIVESPTTTQPPTENSLEKETAKAEETGEAAEQASD